MADPTYTAAQRAYDNAAPPECDTDDRPPCLYCGHAAAGHMASGCACADGCRCRWYCEDQRELARQQERDLRADEMRRLVSYEYEGLLS